ncbi:hypothetical protein B0O80DRAFT_251733 [Mortierella sp. GBAus27b]|nr:hypothetical protein B0O80DRAFT_251733 [Mortierella sp. GBAus27b]
MERGDWMFAAVPWLHGIVCCYILPAPLFFFLLTPHCSSARTPPSSRPSPSHRVSHVASLRCSFFVLLFPLFSTGQCLLFTLSSHSLRSLSSSSPSFPPSSSSVSTNSVPLAFLSSHLLQHILFLLTTSHCSVSSPLPSPPPPLYALGERRFTQLTPHRRVSDAGSTLDRLSVWIGRCSFPEIRHTSLLDCCITWNSARYQL